MIAASAVRPVLIVGGGPVGLMMAILLARQGQQAIVFEKKLPRESSAPKAHVLNPRSLEICRAMGIDVDAMRRLSAHASAGNCARFMRTLNGAEFGSLPFEAPAAAPTAAPTPTPLLNLAQPLFEAVLQRHAEALPGIEIRRGHAFLSCESSAQGVRAQIQSVDGCYAVDASYLIGADGANSAVREHLGIGMDGVAAVRPRVTIHFEADLHHIVGDRPAVLYWVLDPDAHGTFIAYDIGRTWVYAPRHVPQQFDRADFPDARCEQLIRRAVGDDRVTVKIKHVVPWMMSAQVATRYQCGRCFLVGDAAHRFPPTGGLGLNTGLQDAHNLAWKLAAVLKGRADAATLLASYESERLPVARINTQQSLANADKLTGLFRLAAEVLDAGHPDAVQCASLAAEVQTHREHFLSEGLQLGFCYGPPVRGPADPTHYEASFEPGARMPHAWLQVGGETVSTLDLLDPTRFTLLLAPAAGRWVHWHAQLPDCHTVTLPAQPNFAPAWLAHDVLTRGGALLVRPDGHVACLASDDSDAAFDAVRRTLANFGFGAFDAHSRQAAELVTDCA
ncbi:MAG TPA: FAD-dependent monooxygenase [Pseudorhodoferax sp.]|nr:FAD-dependent monooxygenase [Pseudorhodoferax sp.]